MIVRHTFDLRAVCPVDGSADLYACEVVVDRVLPVEEIGAAAAEVAAMVAYQENVTAWLARRLGARVRTVGWHTGVRTEVEAP